MKKRVGISLAALLGTFALSPAFGGTSILSEKFDHDFHNAKAFNPAKFECAKCHNFSLDPASGKLVPNADLERSAFRVPLKEMCHQCHQSTDPKFGAAPKTCFTCHSNPAGLSAIKPANHGNVSWKTSHSLEARTTGDSCLNCHTTSQCVKCHTERNDIVQRNHPRNFKVTHSIQARLQPQRCDACHTKTFCTNCHLRGK